MKQALLLISLLIASCVAASDVPGGYQPNGTPAMNSENGYAEPFQMFDNLYYVGDSWVSAYIIKTSEGLILVDTLAPHFGRWIPENLKKLGLSATDIKYVLVTHGHSDHVGGAHFFQQTYGSKIVMTQADYELAAAQASKSAAPSDFVAPAVDIVATDSGELTLGDTTLRLYITPGHTRGCLSIDFFANSGGNRYRAFINGGNGTNFEGVEQARMYANSVARIRRISQTPPVVEVNLSNHPRMNQLFQRREKMADSGSSSPFVDAGAFSTFLDILEDRGNQKLQEEIR